MTSILATIVVLWVYAPTSKGMQWSVWQTAPSMEYCEKDLVLEALASEGGKGPIEDFKCVKYVKARR